MTNAPLRGCPLCGTKVEDAKLGLRDYRWLAGRLPGRVAPSDVDFLLERNGQFLVIEFKPTGVALPMGQRISLKMLAYAGFSVWIVWGDDPVEVGEMNHRGDVYYVAKCSVDQLADRVAKWFKEATSG